MLLFLVGLLAIACQIVLLRELNVAAYGIELVYGIALAGWMAAGGAGAAWRSRSRPGSPRRVAWLLVASALALPFDVALVRASRLLLAGVPGAYLPFRQQLLVLAVSLGPLSFALGAAFRQAAHASAAHGRSLAACYAIESAGAVAGAAAATLALALGMQTLTLAVLTAGSVSAAVLLAGLRKPTAAAAAAAAMLTAAALAPHLDLSMTRWAHPDAVETRDSPYARITATVSGGQASLFADDVLVAESESSQQEELADVAALAHPDPRRILLLGGSAEHLASELRRHRPDRLDAVEMDRVLADVARRRMGVASTPIVGDPRDFLRRAPSYDLIVLAMPGPTSGQSNRFYTAEFFAECRRHLAPGGVLGFRLAMPENVVTPILAVRTASIVAAVRSSFPNVLLLQGGSAIVLASPSPLPDDAGVLVARWHARGLATRLVTPAYVRYLYASDRRQTLARVAARPVAPNTDARPVCYLFAAVTWLSRFYPALLRLDPVPLSPIQAAAGRHAVGEPSPAGWRPLFANPLGVGAACVVLAALIVGRRRPAARAAMLAGVSGFCGMLLETVLLLAYQARSGALYERIGLLLMAFMAGLAAGAWLVAALAPPGRSRRAVRALAVVMLLVLAAAAATTAALVAAGAAMSLLVTGIALLVGGMSVGGVFACAAATSEDRSGGAAGRLYGADLWGGAVGSLAGSLALVPLAGLVPTSWVVAGLGLLALLLV